jgi:transcriptional regulator with GAF, ATPase, and Fis domain
VEALVAMNPNLTPEDQLLAQKMLDAYRRHAWNQEAAPRELGLTRGEWRSRAARLGLDAVRRRRR